MPLYVKLKFHKKKLNFIKNWIHGRCDSSVHVSSWRKPVRKLICESIWQPSHEFPPSLLPRQNDTEEKGRKNLWHQKKATNSQQRTSFLNFHTLRNPFQSFWSSALVSALEGTSAFEPLQPMAKSRNGTGGAFASADQKLRVKIGVGKFLTIKKGFVYTSFDAMIQGGLRMHPEKSGPFFRKLNVWWFLEAP